MKKTVIAASAIAILGVAAGAPAAIAHPSSHQAAAKPAAAKTFKSKVTPHKNVKVGKTITDVGTGAPKNTKYICLEVISNGNALTTAKDTNVLVSTKSNAKGKVTCKFKVVAFSGPAGTGGKTVHCPTTAKDKKAGYSCGIALGDAKTLGASSVSLAKFTAKK